MPGGGRLEVAITERVVRIAVRKVRQKLCRKRGRKGLGSPKGEGRGPGPEGRALGLDRVCDEGAVVARGRGAGLVPSSTKAATKAATRVGSRVWWNGEWGWDWAGAAGCREEIPLYLNGGPGGAGGWCEAAGLAGR